MKITYIELVGVPASGKTTKALKLIKDNEYLYPGRRSLKCDYKIQEISFLGLPKKINIFNLLVVLPEDIFFTLIFISYIRGSIKSKFLNTLSMLYLIQKSRFLSKSKINFIIDQGIQQFILHLYFKDEISIKNAKKLSAEISQKKWSAEKYIFLTCSFEEMQFRISRSKKHIQQLSNENILQYCERYLKAFKKLNLEKGLKNKLQNNF